MLYNAVLGHTEISDIILSATSSQQLFFKIIGQEHLKEKCLNTATPQNRARHNASTSNRADITWQTAKGLAHLGVMVTSAFISASLPGTIAMISQIWTAQRRPHRVWGSRRRRQRRRHFPLPPIRTTAHVARHSTTSPSPSKPTTVTTQAV